MHIGGCVRSCSEGYGTVMTDTNNMKTGIYITTHDEQGMHVRPYIPPDENTTRIVIEDYRVPYHTALLALIHTQTLVTNDDDAARVSRFVNATLRRLHDGDYATHHYLPSPANKADQS